MMKILAARAREKAVDIRLGTPVKKIIREGNRVTGVIAEKDRKTMRVNAGAVVIGTGGYANHREWIKKYTGFDLEVNLFPMGNAGKMGDGIRMAWEVGAAEEGMGLLQLVRVGPLLGPGAQAKHLLEPVGVQPNLYVNQRGERYFDEGMAPNFAFDGNALTRQKERYSYNIFDEAAKRDMVEKGVVMGLGMMLPPGTRFARLDEGLKITLEQGNPNVFVADSIEGLAIKMGINANTLKATVDEYNEFCEKGHDDLFAKDPRYLRPLKVPKFYAIKNYAAFIGTLGGIKINHKMEVLDREERAIPGLYAGGIDAGGVYGDSYDVFSGGSTLGFAVNSGRIAGRNALKYLGK